MALEVVETPAPAVVTAEAIAAALERRKEAATTPLEHFDDELGGICTYRVLSGAEVRECRKLATVDLGKPTQRVDTDRLEFYIVNKATREPKVTQVLWAQLGQLGPLVQAGLSAAIFTACGLIGDPVEQAKNDWSESPT